MAESDLDYAKVTGRLAFVTGDGVDAGDKPDIVWCTSGTVRIEPLAKVSLVTGSATPFTAANDAVIATINSSGYLTRNGSTDVWVPDLTSSKVNPQIAAGMATHRLVFLNVMAGSVPVPMGAKKVRITAAGPDGTGVNDISKLAPVEAAPTQPIYRGEQGVSVTSASTSGGNLTLGLSNGGSLNAGALPASGAVADDSITAAKIATALKGGAAAGTEALRALGTTSTTAAAGDHRHTHAWVTGRAYVVNELVINADLIYRVSTAHTSGGSFDATKFTAVSSAGGGSASAVLAVDQTGAPITTAKLMLVTTMPPPGGLPDETTVIPPAGYVDPDVMLKSDNLAGLASTVTARENLGIGARRQTARALLGNAVRLQDVNVYASPTPTVTLGTAGAAPTISGAVRYAPKRTLAGTLIDDANDPHFEYVGLRPGTLDVSSGDVSYPRNLTGGSSQARRDNVRFRFTHTGQEFEAYFRARSTAIKYRIWVDGLPVADPQNLTVVSSSRYWVKVAFATRATRIIEIDVVDPEFGGVAIGPADSIDRPRSRRQKWVGFGDSITGGALGVGSNETWLILASRAMDCDWINASIGGTGYIASNSGVAAAHQRVAADVIPFNPELLTVFFGYNDVALDTAANIAAAATTVLTTLATALPFTVIVVAGPWNVGSNAWAAGLAVDNALRVAVTALGLSYISLLDAEGQLPTGTAWAASTAYVPGDVRIANGWAQKCIIGHTSGASFVQTNWRACTFVNGTGKVGATAGNGNADVVINTDGVHPTLEGQKALAAFMVAEHIRAIRVIAGAT